MHQLSLLSQPSHGPRALRHLVRAVDRTTRLLVAVLALLVLVVPSTARTVNVATSTYLCTGYAGCQAAGYGNAGYRQASGTAYWSMYVGHNCTNYVAYRLIQSGMANQRPWEGNGNASNWGVEMASITDQTPRVGSVAWYKPHVTPAGSAGHVAYVEQVVSDTEIIVSEDYWGGDFHWRRITKDGGGWPTGFIHFNDRVVEPTTPPTISGTPAVGAPLEIAVGAWTPTPESVTVRWLADGAAVPGATAPSYVPTPDVKGKTLTVEITSQLSGYTPGRAVLTTAPVAPGAFQPTALPTIQGTAEVGQSLTLTAPSWSPQPTRVSTQWYADGNAIDGATGSTLVLTRDHVDRRISARVTASASGYRKSTSTAPETAPVLAKPVQVVTPFVIEGRVEVGSRLLARTGTLRPSNATVAYTWLRDGQRIARTTRPTYTVRRADLGRSLAVQVTLTQQHYRPTAATIAVPGLVTTTPTLRVRPDAKRGRVAVEVRVKAPGAPRPDGVISVQVGGRVVQGTVVDGTARLVVRDLGPGRKPLVVRYAGTDLVQPAVDRSHVTVPRRHG